MVRRTARRGNVDNRNASSARGAALPGDRPARLELEGKVKALEDDLRNIYNPVPAAGQETP